MRGVRYLHRSMKPSWLGMPEALNPEINGELLLCKSQRHELSRGSRSVAGSAGMTEALSIASLVLMRRQLTRHTFSLHSCNFSLLLELPTICSSLFHINEPDHDRCGSTNGEEKREPQPVVVSVVDDCLYDIRSDDG